MEEKMNDFKYPKKDLDLLAENFLMLTIFSNFTSNDILDHGTYILDQLIADIIYEE